MEQNTIQDLRAFLQKVYDLIDEVASQYFFCEVSMIGGKKS